MIKLNNDIGVQIRIKDTHEVLNPTSITISNEEIVKVFVENTEYDKEVFEVLPVLKVDDTTEVVPGCTGVYKGMKFTFRYGIHTNRSGSTIKCWYMDPLEDTVEPEVSTGYDSLSIARPSHIRTLYEDMIKDITEICFS